MPQTAKLEIYKNHLETSYNRLLERAIEYRFIDEPISDMAAYKAMKVLEKLSQLNYLKREFSI